MVFKSNCKRELTGFGNVSLKPILSFSNGKVLERVRHVFIFAGSSAFGILPLNNVELRRVGEISANIESKYIERDQEHFHALLRKQFGSDNAAYHNHTILPILLYILSL